MKGVLYTLHVLQFEDSGFNAATRVFQCCEMVLLLGLGGSLTTLHCFQELIIFFNSVLKQHFPSLTPFHLNSLYYINIIVFLVISLFITKCLEHVYYAVCHLLYRRFLTPWITGKKNSRNVYHSLSILQEKCCQYWPSEGSVTHGEITVEIKNDSLLDAISVRDFLVTYNQVMFLNYMRFKMHLLL